MDLYKKEGDEKTTVGNGRPRPTVKKDEHGSSNKNQGNYTKGSGTNFFETTQPDYGIIKAKPAREIYQPPSLRKSRTTSFYPGGSDCGNDVGSKGHTHAPSIRVLYYQSQPIPEILPGPMATGHDYEVKSKAEANVNQLLLANKSNPSAAGRLSQSKSSNSMFAQFQKHCRQLEQQQLEEAAKNSQSGIENLESNQSNSDKINCKASGGKPYQVRFEESGRFTTKDASAQKNEMHNGNFAISSRKPELVRSKSMLYKTPLESCAEQPTFNRKLWNAFHSDQSNARKNTPCFGGVKRSKSFSSKMSTPRSNLTSFSLNDFQLSKWPKGVVEAVTTALNGVERVPARYKIDMVTRIFGTVLGDYESTLTFGSPTEPQDLNQYVVPAITIFLYFIQKDSDETVVESFLNNALMTYQSLFDGSKVKGQVSPGPEPLVMISIATTSKWCTFLLLLSSFYQEAKLISNRPSSLVEFNQRVLSLLCDSALTVIRLARASCTMELVDTLFTVMTSLGRDIEAKFPLKMKGILAAVRDVLLGVSTMGPVTADGATIQVHKMLMQLIELHAANWQLPASAVRYYYATSTGNAQQQFLK